MFSYKNKKLNKILIIVAIVLVVIAIIVSLLFVLIKDKKEQISYEDTLINKNYFVQMTINLETKEIKRDGIETSLSEEFDIDSQHEEMILSSREELNNFFTDSVFEIESTENNLIKITNKYQTKKIIVEAEKLNKEYNAERVEEVQEGLYILTYDSQKKTKAAYEYLKNVEEINKVELDEVSIIETINDESQIVYSETDEKNEIKYNSYGVQGMGLDNYKKIIEENGNPSEVIVATIGYGACIDNTYFNGRITENYFNFIDDSKEVKETIAQGSRILEVIKDSTTDNVKIMPLVVINAENYTTTVSIIKAISYASKNADIICYEFANKENDMISLCLENAFKENVPVCCVTNKNSENEELYPANNATTIAVSSIDKKENTTSYSSKGEYLDFVAYSTDVKEIFNSNTSVSRWSGAYYSNAQIVSSIALIKTYNKDFTILEIYNIIRNYCKDLGEEGRDNIYGYGCPNFSKIKIADIDKKNPEFKEINFDNENWELEKNIKIVAEDNIKIYGWAISNLDEKPEKLNKLDKTTNKLETITKIDKNGTYYIWVVDTAGNAVYYKIDVNKIDNTKPEIEYAIDNSKRENEGYVTITVTATDSESGLHDMAYSWDKVNWSADSNTLKVIENGRHKIYVKDKLENIAEKEIIIKTFPLEGTATIGDGEIIKTVVVSDNWSGNQNNNVRITFNDDLNIEGWKITQTSDVPAEFSEVEENNANDVEDTNLENTVIDNSADDNSIQGYSNLTITVSLKINTTYYAWIKNSNGEVLCQSFSISKAEI